MKTQNLISAALIVQDEQDYISRVLSNIKDYVDEIVVIDGGSTDKTVEICESFGAKVYHRKFDMDFATQRNYSLDMCTHDNVLVIDADEYCSDDILKSLNALAQIDKNIGVFNFRMTAKVEFSDGTFYHPDSTYAGRLVRKSRGRWVNRIHEVFKLHDGFKSHQLADNFEMYNVKTSSKQDYNNALYYNLDNGIYERPDYNTGMTYKDGKWIYIENHRNNNVKNTNS